MSWHPPLSLHVPSPRPIDNSRVVREVDPQSSRDLWSLLLLVAALVGGLALYAWPHFQARQTSSAAAELQHERDRLLEQNRQLRLEKEALENLARIETIATRDLAMTPPAPERVVIVELPSVPPEDASPRLARDAAPEASRN
jgi:cell division protein FtsL